MTGRAPDTSGLPRMDTTPLFSLGLVVATIGALGLCEEAGVDPADYINRHVVGDWGELDPEDWQANQEALATGARLLSAYTISNGGRLWIITEWDRSATTLLLPTDY